MPGSPRQRSPRRWSLQDAKNKLSAVVDAAARGTPQIVTRRGVETAVVISYEEYQRITAEPAQPSLAGYLLAIPGTGGEDEAEEIERIELEVRDAEL